MAKPEYSSLRWRQLRQQALTRAKGVCEGRGCNKDLRPGKWHLHHTHYRTAGKETLHDVKALCLDCHSAEHPHKKPFVPAAARRKAKPSAPPPEKPKKTKKRHYSFKERREYAKAQQRIIRAIVKGPTLVRGRVYDSHWMACKYEGAVL